MSARKTKVIIEGYGPTTITEIGPDDTEEPATATGEPTPEALLAVMQQAAKDIKAAEAALDKADEETRTARTAFNAASHAYDEALTKLHNRLREGSGSYIRIF